MMIEIEYECYKLGIGVGVVDFAEKNKFNPYFF